jgi:hypothetical protein
VIIESGTASRASPKPTDTAAIEVITTGSGSGGIGITTRKVIDMRRKKSGGNGNAPSEMTAKEGIETRSETRGTGRIRGTRRTGSRW